MTNSQKLFLTAVKYLGTKESLIGWDEQIKAWIFASCDSLKISRPEDDAKFAWCACFISNILIEAGIWPQNTLHIVSARKFLAVGTPIESPELGDICVLERGPGKGHIGIFINGNLETVKLLSGNSMDSVSISDFKKSRLLGYRRL